MSTMNTEMEEKDRMTLTESLEKLVASQNETLDVLSDVVGGKDTVAKPSNDRPTNSLLDRVNELLDRALRCDARMQKMALEIRDAF